MNARASMRLRGEREEEAIPANSRGAGHLATMWKPFPTRGIPRHQSNSRMAGEQWTC